MKGKRNLKMYLAALALFLSGMGYLVAAGLSAGETYHIDVADALLVTDTKPLRVFGAVAEADLVRGPDAMGISFRLRDQKEPDKTIVVRYARAVPEGFQPGIELYAEGAKDPATGVLAAKSLTTTCPSKYKKENRK